MFRLLLIVSFIGLLSACSNMLFFPLKEHLIDPRERGVEYRDIYVDTADNQKLHGWLLAPVGDTKGTVLFFHGNGENISTHIGAVYWLPKNGYRVILIDYRGYGKSQGYATLDGAIKDIQYSIHYALEHYADNKPFVVLGQSIGASMSIYAVATLSDTQESGKRKSGKQDIDGLVLVAPFSDYQKITREALSRSWLTWLFQVPLSWTINSDYNPDRYIKAVNPVPVYFIHGTDDNIISVEHSAELYRLAMPPKKRFLIEGGGHNDLAATEKFKEVLLQVLQDVIALKEK